MSTRIPRPRTETDRNALVSKPTEKSPTKKFVRSNLSKIGKCTKKNAVNMPEIKKFVKPSHEKTKKSPLREVNVNKIRPVKENHTVKAVSDRRGISEIKRSELNLREKLGSLECDMQSMKHELSEVKHDIQKKNVEIDDMKGMESTLKEQVEELWKENEAQSLVLEEMGVDPVSKHKIETSSDFGSLVTSCGQKQMTFATELQSCLSEFEFSLDDILVQLDRKPEIIEYV